MEKSMPIGSRPIDEKFIHGVKMYLSATVDPSVNLGELVAALEPATFLKYYLEWRQIPKLDGDLIELMEQLSWKLNDVPSHGRVEYKWISLASLNVEGKGSFGKFLEWLEASGDVGWELCGFEYGHAFFKKVHGVLVAIDARSMTS
jgi:hypothetical protein